MERDAILDQQFQTRAESVSSFYIPEHGPAELVRRRVNGDIQRDSRWLMTRWKSASLSRERD